MTSHFAGRDHIMDQTPFEYLRLAAYEDQIIALGLDIMQAEEEGILSEQQLSDKFSLAVQRIRITHTDIK